MKLSSGIDNLRRKAALSTPSIVLNLELSTPLWLIDTLNGIELACFVRYLYELNVCSVNSSIASKMLSSAIGIITKELQNGGEVNITGFGAFKVSHRAARNGVNPRTKEAIKIPAMKSPVFRSGKTFKEAIR